MTISLEEHVARAIEGCTSHNLPKITIANMASAAIAVVREREGAVTGIGDDEGFIVGVNCGPDAPDPAKPVKAKLNWLPKAKPMPYPDEEPDPAEATRAAKDNLKHFVEHIAALHKDGFPNEAESAVHANELRAAEAMRAKTIDECEAIARAMPGWRAPRDVADAIAALKGNGEGQ